MSTVLVVSMSIFTIFVVSSETAIIKDYSEFPGSSIVKDICPTVGLAAAQYRVSVITEMSSDSLPIGGCAFINNWSTDVSRKSLSLWIGNLNNGMQRCREKDMEHFEFSCLAESHSDEYMKGVMFAQILGRVNNKENKSSTRCAIHDMVKGNSTIFRIAVSGNDSCLGLVDVLQSNLQTTIPDGAMVLQLTRIRLVSNQMRAGHSASIENANITKHF